MRSVLLCPWRLTRLRLSPLSLMATRNQSKISELGLVQESLKKYIRWYPQDTVTCSNIDTFFALQRDTRIPHDLLVGLVYENENIRLNSKVLQTLLADPLASGSEAWYKKLCDRSATENNLVSPEARDAVQLLPGAFLRTVNCFLVPAPMLGETRLQFPDLFAKTSSAANYMHVLEINRHSDVAKLVDVCLFYIYVTSDLSTLMDTLPKLVQKKILVAVVDNKEFTPRSTQSTAVTFLTEENVSNHVVKIDSLRLLAGIDEFYEKNIQAASQYFESVQASNILELAKLLSWYLRTENLRSWLFDIIRTEIGSNNLSETQIRAIYKDLELNTLVQGSQQMHLELQKDFMPRAQDFFRRKLRWWMLYLRNDNVEYMLKDFFSREFMPKSIESYSYLKGQLVARLQEQKFANYSKMDRLQLDNPLQSFKTDLINNRVPLEIQLVVYSSLVAALLYYQLPLSVLSLVGYTWLGILSQTSLAIAGLGWVLGFDHVLKTWHEFTKKWLADLFDQVRLVISQQCMDEGLLKELNSRFEGAQDLARIKRQVVEVLDAAAEKSK